MAEMRIAFSTVHFSPGHQKTAIRRRLDGVFVERLEEELEFFKELHAPETPPGLQPPGEDEV